MKLKIISTGSKGNCYLLTASTGKSLLLEAGITWSKIQQAIDFNYKDIEACIITHEHKDHCKAVKDVAGAAIKVYASYGTHKAMNTINHRFAHIAKVAQAVQVGEFKIMGFDIKHDAAQPFGFLISHPECGEVLFLTDTYYVEYQFPGLNNIIVEANYDQEIIDNKGAPKFLRDRILQSHMSIDTTIKLLKHTDLSKVNNIVLCHLSDSNSDEEKFAKKAIGATGVQVHIAQAGKVILFDKNPF